MLDGKTILITGGTGSFGRKFTEIVLNRYNVEKIIIFSCGELKQTEMKTELGNNRKLGFYRRCKR